MRGKKRRKREGKQEEGNISERKGGLYTMERERTNKLGHNHGHMREGKKSCWKAIEQKLKHK